MKIFPVSAFMDNYIWLIIDEINKTAICVDPGDAEPVIDYLEQEKIKLDTILLTHHHQDHIAGTFELVARDPKLKIYGPIDLRIPQVSHSVTEGSILLLGSHKFQVLSTPGHTSTHLCYYEPNFFWLFCGDTLFSAGCGRVFDGTQKDLYTSLERLKTLPDITEIYCGHEYTRNNLKFANLVEPNNFAILEMIELLNQDTSCTLPSNIAREKQINPFLRTDIPSVLAYAKLMGSNCASGLDVFKTIRHEKNHFNHAL